MYSAADVAASSTYEQCIYIMISQCLTVTGTSSDSKQIFEGSFTSTLQSHHLYAAHTFASSAACILTAFDMMQTIQ